MEFVRDNWPLVLVVVVVALVIAFVLLRPRQRVRLTDSAPIRPHMAISPPPSGRGVAGEAAAATADVTGEIIGAPVRSELDGEEGPHDDLCRLKGVGPRFADALNALGFHRYDQLARLTPPEIDRLDTQLGAFGGRLARDRVAEQADYLARNDLDGFEQRFGKL